MTDWSTDYLGSVTLSTSGTYRLTKADVTTASDGSITAALSLTVHGTTSDTLAAYMQTLLAQLRIGGVWVHSMPGVTSPVHYLITGVDAVQLEDLTWQANWQAVSFTLTLATHPAGALTTLYAAQALDTPGSLTLAALLGIHPPQLDVTVDDASGNDMHSCHVCLAPRVLTSDQTIAMGTRAHWLIYASSLTWTTMSNRGATATSWSNDPRYTISASWQSAPLDTAKYPAGTYKLLARVRQEAGVGYVMDSRQQVAIPVTRTTFHLVELGDVQLPTQDTAYGTAANLTLYARSDGTNDLDVDAYLLLPIDHGLTYYHPDVDTTEIDQLDVGPSGTFLDGVTNTADVIGGILEPKTLAAHVGTMIATASPTGSDFPASWDKTDAQCSADSGYFKCVAVDGSSWMWYAKTAAATPLVVPGEWYEVSANQNVTAYTDGDVEMRVRWLDVDGNTVREDVMNTADGAPAVTAPIFYVKAPAQAVRARVMMGAGTDATFTAYWDSVVFRRCPMQLIVVAEDAAGALTSNVHAVAVTLKYTGRYEVAR
jgi:hypothetical protein